MTKDIFAFLWLLAFVASAVLTLIGIFRWLAHTDKRSKRLDIVSYCAFIVFLFMLLSANWTSISSLFHNSLGENQAATRTLISTSKVTVKILLIAIIIALLVLLTLTAALFVIYGLWAIIHGIRLLVTSSKEKSEEDLHDKSEKLKIMLNNPVFILIIVIDIMAIFGIVPIVMGGNSANLATNWKSGVIEISHFFMNNDIELNFTKALSIYLLIYIAILGIGYAASSILYKIIKNSFDRKNRKSLLSQYSNTIGLIAVAVSVLLMISWGIFKLKPESSWTDLLFNILKTFALGIFIIIIGVITLEIMRHIMEMRKTLLRKEARYVFIMLAGQCAVIIVKAFSLIYNALSSMLTGNEMQSESRKDSMGDILKQIPEKIAQDIIKELSGAAGHGDNMKMPYAAFKKNVTKK